MAHRLPFIVLAVVFFACGGQESGNPPGGSGTSAGGGGTVAGGTGGSSGTVATGVGGANTAGQSGVGGAGQGGADWSSCTTGKDACVLEAVGACGPGCEPVAISAFIAINSSSQVEYNKSHPPAPCVAIVCPSSRPGEANYPNYFAECESGQCRPVDVRTNSLSACSDSSECTLRSGTTCCGCGSDNLIAVSKKVNVEQVFCGPGRACAADCAVAPLPPGVSALCSVGHCIVHYDQNPTGGDDVAFGDASPGAHAAADSGTH